MKVKSLSCVRLVATPWTAAHQAPPSMGFSRQEYWSGVPLPSPWCSIATDKEALAPEHLTLRGGHVSTLGKTKDDGQVWVRLQSRRQTCSESHEPQVLIWIFSLTNWIPLGGCHNIAEAPPLPVQ